MRLRRLLVPALAGLACAGAVAGAAGTARAGSTAAPAVAADRSDARVAAGFAGPAVLAAANRLRAAVGVPPLQAGSHRDFAGAGDWLVSPDARLSAQEVMGSWPQLLAVLLDPRTTLASTEPRASGTVALSLHTDASLPLPRPVLPLRLDPASPLGVTVLLPARPRSVRLLETRPTGEVALPLELRRAAGAGGASLVQLDGSNDGLRIAYAMRYRLVVDGTSWMYATSALPRAYLARGWRFGPTMRPGDRAAFRRALASAPPFAHVLVAQLDGAITVDRRSCDMEDSSCAKYDESGAYSMSIAPANFADSFADLRYVVLHELAHLVDYVGLDSGAYGAFRSLFRTSPRWRGCFPNAAADRGCVDFAEILADQFAYWATELRADPGGGYGDPPLVASARFEAVLRAQWAFRPPLWRNPAVRAQ